MLVEKYKLYLQILELLNQQKPNKYVLRDNLIGYSQTKGIFEGHFNLSYDDEQKAELDNALRKLQELGHIRPAYREILNRGKDLVITDKGRKALVTRVFDDLDELLSSVSPDLVIKRYGAYDAVLHRQTDWQSQAANSLIELLDRTLRLIAPDTDVKNSTWFSEKEVKREHRVRYFIETKTKTRSKSTEKIHGANRCRKGEATSNKAFRR